MAQLSVDVAVPVLPGSVFAVQSIVIFAGHMMDGGESSIRVIVCWHVVEFPQSSEIVQDRITLQNGAVFENTNSSVYINVVVPPQSLVAAG